MERDTTFIEINNVPVSLTQVMEFLGSNPRLQQLPIATIEKLAGAVQPRVFGPREKLVNIPSGIYIVWDGELTTGNSRNVLKRAEYGTQEELQGAIASDKVTCLLLDPDHAGLIYKKNIWNSSEVISSVEKIMQLEIMGVDLYRGFSIPGLLTFNQMFGGQLVGQALAAASKSVNPFLLVHSLHSYFLRPGDTNIPVVYQVERVQDSRNFASRFVRATQNNKIIFTMSASFQREDNGVEHQISMPDAPQPEKLMPEESEYEKYLLSPHLSSSIKEAIMENLKKERPLDVRCCEYMDHIKPEPCDSRDMVWFRAKGDVSRDQALHRCIAAYASDWIFLDCALKPHGWTCGPDNVYQTTNNSDLKMLSLDHTLWFHKSLKVDQWHLFSMESPRAASSRALVMGHIYSQSGELVISAAQEGLIRRQKLASKL